MKPSNAPFHTSPSRDAVFTEPKQSGGASSTFDWYQLT